MAELPQLLVSADGTPVTTPAQWAARREELKSLVQEHILGWLPPANATPTLTKATLINASSPSLPSTADAFEWAFVNLKFDANGTPVSFPIELMWRSDAGDGGRAVPLVLTQWNHKSWCFQGVQRGWLCALYPGADTRDASGDFQRAFPTASFRKILARAYVASRVLDFVLSPAAGAVPGLRLPAVNASRVGITGHSRNGKQSVIAAAFDERFTAVVGSSPGTPISAPIRFSSPDFNGETVNYVTPGRGWWLPSVKSYFGREDEIPADGHMVLSLVAPRHAMIATARSDGEGDVTFAGEQNVAACAPVWVLLGAPNALRQHVREGRHHGFVDPHVYFDWFDAAGGVAGTAGLFPDATLPHAFDWDEWRAAQPRSTPPALPPPSAPLADRVAWLMGGGTLGQALAAGAVGGNVGGSGYCESGAVGNEWDYKASLMMHDSLTPCTNEGYNCRSRPSMRLSLCFGSYITASLFVPCEDAACKGVKTPLPVVVFLHGFSYQLGWTGIYGLYNGNATGLINGLVQGAGVAVLAFDLPGFGSRQTEGAASFYRRNPSSSLLGAMVGEVEAALDMVRCTGPPGAGTPACGDGNRYGGAYPSLDVPALDASRVYLVGYSLGAAVAVHAAALFPDRIAGVAAFGGWTPLRGGPNATGGGGALRMLARTHAVAPRLGYFAGAGGPLAAASVPYDYDELITAVAPRPVLLYTPTLSRFADAGGVAEAVARAGRAWAGHEEALTVARPDAPSDFRSAEVAAAIEWVRGVVGRPLKG